MFETVEQKRKLKNIFMNSINNTPHNAHYFSALMKPNQSK